MAYGWPAIWYLRDWRFFLPQSLARIGPHHPHWLWLSPPEDRFAFSALALLADAMVAGVVLLGVGGGLGGQRVASSLRTDVAIPLPCSGVCQVLGFAAGVSPGLMSIMAYACLYIAILFAGYAICTFAGVCIPAEERSNEDGNNASACSK